jgi:hypothetical protein
MDTGYCTCIWDRLLLIRAGAEIYSRFYTHGNYQVFVFIACVFVLQTMYSVLILFGADLPVPSDLIAL